METWEINLSKDENNKFILSFTCLTSSQKILNKKVGIRKEYKGVKIGIICNELFNLGHLKWTRCSPKKTGLYEYEQPDMMLQDELAKVKKIN